MKLAKSSTEKALVRSEARFRQVVEFAPNAMVMTRANGEIDMVNAQTERVFGYVRGELIGQSIEMLLPARFRDHHSGLRRSYVGDPQPRVMGSGRDLYGLKKDGSEFPVEVGLNPIETGEGMMVLSTIVDISDRKHREEITRLSEERFRSIFNAVSEGIFLFDVETGIFADCNDPAAAMLGYTREELTGATVSALSSGVSPYTEHDANLEIARLTAAGKPLRLAWQSRTKDGRIFPTEVSLRVASINGRETAIAIVRDMTDQAAIEQQLRQAQKMEAVGNLTGGLAHDFNNLLGVIIGNIDLLRERISEDHESDLLAEGALSAALRGADLTKSLLAFSRRQPLVPRTIDVTELVLNLSKLLSRTLGENIEIHHDFGEHLWPVVVDPVQLEGCLLNIITNARDAMPDGGRLSITTRNKHLDQDYADLHSDVAAGNYTMIEVTDSGAGMSETTIARMFEPFFTTKKEGRGTGLGLSMVFGFIKQSAGHVSAYSELGMGSTFRIYLPQASNEVDADMPTPPVDETGDGQTILVVEDNTKFRELVVRQLTQLGYACLEAPDGPSALKLLETEEIDLLFSDVIMPGGMSGKELAEVARTRWPKVKSLLTSGFPEEKVRQVHPNKINVRLLNKPYRKEELSQAIAEVLSGR